MKIGIEIELDEELSEEQYLQFKKMINRYFLNYSEIKAWKVRFNKTYSPQYTFQPTPSLEENEDI